MIVLKSREILANPLWVILKRAFLTLFNQGEKSLHSNQALACFIKVQDTIEQVDILCQVGDNAIFVLTELN